MQLSIFDYDLPTELIAQEATADRTAARLIQLDRRTGKRGHHHVADLPGLLARGDLLIVNNTRVFPARLRGHRVPSGGAVECLLLGRIDGDRWDALVHPGQKLKVGTRAMFEGNECVLSLEVLTHHFHGRRTVCLTVDPDQDIDHVIDTIGDVPLPPYIRRAARPDDRERYQTVYAKVRGSVAAPTAGLHLTAGLLDQLAAGGIECREITLHVGYGTFQPVRDVEIESHRVAEEQFAIPEATARAVNQAVEEGRRVVAVGTTTTRALETASRQGGGRLLPGVGVTDLYIYPGFDFRVVGGLLTNLHLPRSSLLLLVCAFAGREVVLEAYAEAVQGRYRFYSYGDAMLIL